MSAILIAALLVCMSAHAWEIEKHVDEMTDATWYAIYTTGEPVKINDLITYSPQLQVRIHPVKYLSTTDKMHYRAEVLVAIETDGFRRNGPAIMTRFDDAQPTTAEWTSSTDRHAAFAPDPHQLIAQMIPAAVLRVRYVTTLGHVRTTKFSVSGLASKLASVKTLYKLSKALAKTPDTPDEPAQPSAPVADPALVAKATSAMNDITRALEYAQNPEGMPPRMQTATSLNKPLTAISRAVSKNISLQNTCQNLEKKFSRSRPGSIGRPTPEQLDRARANAAQSKINLNDAILELRRQARTILQTSDWPTPELSAQAKAISARIPAH